MPRRTLTDKSIAALTVAKRTSIPDTESGWPLRPRHTRRR